jgi:PhnB protein
MTGAVPPIPDGYHTLTAALTVRGAAAAIAFYESAFGARELGRYPAPDGERLWHAELQLGDCRLMLTDEFPELGGSGGPLSLGGTPVGLHLYVPDVDALCARAVAAGATLDAPIENTFWGDRYAKLTDPFGHRWSVATHVEDVSAEEQQRRVAALNAPGPSST